MAYLIQNAEIIAPNSSLNRQKSNILIEKGLITQITPANEIIKAPKETQIIEAEGLKLSIGWFDMRASFKDPGFEHKETLQTGSKAAMFGGFTEVALLPNTHPIVQTKNEIAYIQRFSDTQLVKLHPIAAVTIDAKGTDLTEMIDLHTAGAVAFSDGEKPIQNADILMKTLQYLQKMNALLINKPEDLQLTQFGVMNESINSVMLGLRGMPNLAEEMMIQRDLSLLEYVGGKIHFAGVSSAKSIKLIRKAKQKGLKVSCDIVAHQIAFDDSAMASFDSFLKVNPPFRSEEDIEAIWEGLEDGTIDVIVSDHNPQDEESKNLEFDLAEFGAIGLETAFAVMNTYNKSWKIKHLLTLEQLIEKFAYSPRQLLNLEIPQIKVGEPANLTLFDTEIDWTFEASHIQSKSKNSPFIGQAFKGKAVAVFNQGWTYFA